MSSGSSPLQPLRRPLGTQRHQSATTLQNRYRRNVSSATPKQQNHADANLGTAGTPAKWATNWDAKWDTRPSPGLRCPPRPTLGKKWRTPCAFKGARAGARQIDTQPRTYRLTRVHFYLLASARTARGLTLVSTCFRPVSDPGRRRNCFPILGVQTGAMDGAWPALVPRHQGSVTTFLQRIFSLVVGCTSAPTRADRNRIPCPNRQCR